MIKVRHYVDKDSKYQAWVASTSDKNHDYCSHGSTREEALDNLGEILHEPWDTFQEALGGTTDVQRRR